MQMREAASSASRARRKYDASRRQAEARERQRRVVDAARDLFLEQGYGTTSIEQIAAAADVSVQTVYAAFESKAGILKRVVDVAVAGDHEDVAVADRPEAVAIRAEPDIAEQLRAAGALALESHRRGAPLLRLVAGVAGTDPVLAELDASYEAGHRHDVRLFVDAMPKEALRADLDLDEVADSLALLSSYRTYVTLVLDRGWDGERYAQWVTDSAARLVLRDPGLVGAR
jgi:AcrR family transcriptional regulator